MLEDEMLDAAVLQDIALLVVGDPFGYVCRLFYNCNSKSAIHVNRTALTLRDYLF